MMLDGLQRRRPIPWGIDRQPRQGSSGWGLKVSSNSSPLALAASAGTSLPGTYQLLDHGTGDLGPAYGLRVDAIGEIFSVELGSANVLLTWDGGVTATIIGTVNQNTAGGNGGVGATWTLVYNLTGVSAVGTQGFTATGGAGILTDPSR